MFDELKHNVTNFNDLAPFLNYKLTVHECVHNLHKYTKSSDVSIMSNGTIDLNQQEKWPNQVIPNSQGQNDQLAQRILLHAKYRSVKWNVWLRSVPSFLGHFVHTSKDITNGYFFTNTKWTIGSVHTRNIKKPSNVDE